MTDILLLTTFIDNLFIITYIFSLLTLSQLKPGKDRKRYYDYNLVLLLRVNPSDLGSEDRNDKGRSIENKGQLLK
jgi:hypothetical protein